MIFCLILSDFKVGTSSILHYCHKAFKDNSFLHLIKLGVLLVVLIIFPIQGELLELLVFLVFRPSDSI